VLKAAIFDFDGTILDTESPEYQAWCEVYDAHGHSLDLATWCLGVGTRNGFDPYEHLEGLIAAPIDRDSVRASVRARKTALGELITLREGVQERLDEAKAMGLGLAVASSSDAEWVTPHLDRWDLSRYFDAIICAGAGLAAKPDPALYLSALEQLSARPEEAVAFEDSPNGIAAAKTVGIYTIACPNPVTSLLDLARADLVVVSLAAVSLRELARELGPA